MSNEQSVNINDLVDKYNSFSAQSAKDNYLKATVKNNGYHTFEMVCVEADGIIKSSCYDSNGDLHIDSCRKYINYIFTILKFYTNLNVDEKNFMEQYNLLNQNGLIDKISALVPEEYIKTLDSVLQMKTADMMTNEYNIHAYVNKQLAKLYPHIEKPLDAIFDILNTVVDKVDPNKIKEIMSA